MRDTNSTVVPRHGVEEHAVVVEGSRLVKRVGSMNYESIVSGDVNGRRRPSVIDADDAAREETVWVDIVDVGDVPPDFVNTGESGDGSGEEGEDRGPHDGEAALDARGAERRGREKCILTMDLMMFG